MASRALKEVLKALHGEFSAKPPLSLPSESRRLLQSFVDEHDRHVTAEESAQANTELRAFCDKYVGDNTRKTDLFAAVLKELQPALIEERDRLYWATRVAVPIISGTGHVKPAIEDARDFLVEILVYDEDAEDVNAKAKTSAQLCKDLIEPYLSRTASVTAANATLASENAQIAQQIEEILVAFGRKKPKNLFNLVDDLMKAADTRLRGLSLLNAFLRYQTPHLYLVIHTPLVERLLKCLMNDTSTTILSVALTSLIMLLPHIPGSLGPLLPRLFLVYSRLLCWERFSELSTDAQRDLVTDDRVAREDEHDDDEDKEDDDVGIDANWEKARPLDRELEATTPELRTYFTYLYGLYPLNLMSYIRKPRRYLKNVEFPAADSFDLDQAVIRSRTEQFRQLHLLHPNFYNMTVEEEMIDPKWPKMDPADVVGECQALCLHSKILLTSPGPPPTARLPEVPSTPPLPPKSPRHGVNGQISPVASHTSLRSGGSWRDTQSTAVSSGGEVQSPYFKPINLFPDEDTLPEHLLPTAHKDKTVQAPLTNLEYLQREITLLRNELNFERWHKAQYSQHISQIMRRNVKEATVEAETLNLINANRSLKKQLGQVQKARDATIKDSTLTRKQANNLESNMTDRFNKLKLEQETWQADADELRRLRGEMKQYRDLLVATEARELNKSHQLELAQRDLDELHDVKEQLQASLHRIHEYEYREFDFETALREREMLVDEKEMLQTKLHRNAEHQERMRKAYGNKIADLEVQLEGVARSRDHLNGSNPGLDAAIQRAVAESEAKFAQLKKAHSRLLEKYTDLELQYEALKGSQASSRPDSEDHGYDVINEYSIDGRSSVNTTLSRRRTSDPPRVKAQPLLPSPSTTTVGTVVEIPATAPKRATSVLSRDSGTPNTSGSSLTAGRDRDRDEHKSGWSDGSETTNPKKPKIQPDSSVRVYGRGGAQNIKLKQKDKDKANGKLDGDSRKSSGFKGLRNLV